MRPVEELSDEELAAAKGQIDAWEEEQAKAAERHRKLKDFLQEQGW